MYISQLIRYSRACDIYLDFIDRGRLLTQKLLNQGYDAPKLQSSFLKFYGRHHDLVDRYDKTVSKIKEDLFTWCPFLILDHTRFDVSNMAGVLQKAETAYSSGAPESTPVFCGVHVVHLFLVLCLCCFCLVLAVLRRLSVHFPLP